MLGLSFLEMLVVAVVGLLVLGPERLPKVARQVGWWLGRARAGLARMRSELERETSVQEFRRATQDIESSIGQTVRTTKGSLEMPQQAGPVPTTDKQTPG